MATRTAKGTAKTKTSGTTLTLVSVSCTASHSLIVLVGNQSTNVPTSVKWGNRELNRSRARTNNTSALVASIWILRNIANTDTRDVTVTWGASIGARVLAAMTLDEPHVRDQYIGNVQTASTAPTTGATSALSKIDCFAVGCLVSEGPSSDTAPTLASGWTQGQRDGTVGTPPISNITLIEGYQALTDADAITLSGTGATERDWANVVLAYRLIPLPTPIDISGIEIMVGDQVLTPAGITTTVSSFDREIGCPLVKCILANTDIHYAHTLEVTG